MSYRLKKKSRIAAGVELNLAAMLDMAFQLLAFFILTFQPSPVEGQISLRMPPPIPIETKSGQDIGKDDVSDADILGKDRVILTIRSTPEGDISAMMIGMNPLPNQPTAEQELAQLRQRLPKMFTGTSFDEMVLQVGSGLRYEKLMEVVQICAEQKLNSGEKLNKLTFVEYADGSIDAAAAKAAEK